MPNHISKPSLAIIADDLTGALDASAPFAGRGLWVEVALNPDAVTDAVASGADVIAISTCSREIAAAAATQAVKRAIDQLPITTRRFKKVDSRLKGHIAAELTALNFERALVAPAIPAFQRIVTAGAVTGFGVDTPIPIAPLLGEHASRCTIPDTASHEDLRAALAGWGNDGLLIGARGLAEVLAQQMTGQETTQAPPLAGPRAVLVVGSRDPITLAQVANLRASGLALNDIAAPNGQIGGPPGPDDLTLIQAVAGESAVTGAEVAQNLARGLHPAFTTGCDTVFLTGGATAEAVLGAMGIHRMRLLGDCLPGLPVAVGHDLTIVAKSGGFGAADTLLQVVRMIAKAG